MKRFLIFAVGLLVVIVGGIYLVFCRGFYICFPWGSETSASVPFQTDTADILICGKDGNYTPIEIQGVGLTASMPGNYASAFAPDKGDYLRWLGDIGDMGANTVEIYCIMDDDFYNALYEYNTSNEEPLYLIQGIQVTDAANYGAKSAYDDDFLGELLRNGLACVDVIHGRKINPLGGYVYLCDVSPWVIGYLVGYEWDADTVAYTDHQTVHNGIYQGTYFSTCEEATAFEAMLAKVMDRMISYETDKYHTQRTISFMNAPNTDFLEYEEMYAEQLSKYAWIDAEHILPEKDIYSGYFASYRTYDFCEDFTEYLSVEAKGKLVSNLAQVDRSHVYGGYLDLLSAYHTMPVLLAGYGFSTARGTVKEEPLTEWEQGERLIEVWQDAKEAKLVGVCISTWQDQWERKSWNTAFSISPETNLYWHDLQTDGQNYGLMAFWPGEDPVCLLDGDASEWINDTPALEADGMSLYARSDQEALYLLIEGEDVGEGVPLYVPFDMTDQLGSTSCASPEVSFDRAADFLLCLAGKDNTRILVQERYDAMRENFNNEQANGDPFVSFPDVDSAAFVLVRMAIRNDSLVDTSINRTARELQKLKALGAWETGRLVYGNGNPDASNYNSLADFCFGENCAEIRIPWQLINIADPVDMMIHQDYYINYGVETEHISSCGVGLGDGKETIVMHSVELKRLGRSVTWQEYKKQSYYVVQSYWN